MTEPRNQTNLHGITQTLRNSADARRRSDGVLSESELAYCRQVGIPLAYDPVQIGWVRLDCLDDIGGHSDHQSARQSAGYRFRAWAPEDAPRLALLLSQSEMWTYLPEAFAGPLEPNTALELIALSNGSAHHHVRAVEHGGKIIGQVRLEFSSKWDGFAEISYWLDPKVWGQGHGGAMVKQFADAALQERPELPGLIARVHIENTASARLLQKAGFVRRLEPCDAPGVLYHRPA